MIVHGRKNKTDESILLRKVHLEPLLIITNKREEKKESKKK